MGTYYYILLRITVLSINADIRKLVWKHSRGENEFKVWQNKRVYMIAKKNAYKYCIVHAQLTLSIGPAAWCHFSVSHNYTGHCWSAVHN